MRCALDSSIGSNNVKSSINKISSHKSSEYKEHLEEERRRLAKVLDDTQREVAMLKATLGARWAASSPEGVDDTVRLAQYDDAVVINQLSHGNQRLGHWCHLELDLSAKDVLKLY